MIRSRALEPSQDLCCLPSPHRVPQGVAGIAFNFSKVELAYVPQRTATQEAQRGANAVRGKSPAPRFVFPTYSPAT